jgi:hypothetical protein
LGIVEHEWHSFAHSPSRDKDSIWFVDPDLLYFWVVEKFLKGAQAIEAGMKSSTKLGFGFARMLSNERHLTLSRDFSLHHVLHGFDPAAGRDLSNAVREAIECVHINGRHVFTLE